MSTVNVNSFGLSIDGLSIIFIKDNQSTTLSFDPFATVSLLTDAGMLEGFDKSHYGEPVILFTNNEYGQDATGFMHWCSFIHVFPMSQRLAEMIVDYLDFKKLSNQTQSTIAMLLAPLQATA